MAEQPQALTAALEAWADVLHHSPMRAVFGYLREIGLSMTRMGTLLRLYYAGAARVSDIADELGITGAGASQMLDRLVQQGLVERSEDPDDRRVKLIALTEQGRAVVERGGSLRHAWFTRLAASVQPEEREQVTACLRILMDRARQLDESSEGDSL